MCGWTRFVEEFGDPANQMLFGALVELFHWLGAAASAGLGWAMADMVFTLRSNCGPPSGRFLPRRPNRVCSVSKLCPFLFGRRCCWRFSWLESGLHGDGGGGGERFALTATRAFAAGASRLLPRRLPSKNRPLLKEPMYPPNTRANRLGAATASRTHTQMATWDPCFHQVLSLLEGVDASRDGWKLRPKWLGGSHSLKCTE
jgi:hypothetical protein